MSRSEEYEQYLKSAQWKIKRLHALNRAFFRCQKYKWMDVTKRMGKGLDVHHLTYERFGNERPEDLIVLCRKCHEAEHAR